MRSGWQCRSHNPCLRRHRYKVSHRELSRHDELRELVDLVSAGDLFQVVEAVVPVGGVEAVRIGDLGGAVERIEGEGGVGFDADVSVQDLTPSPLHRPQNREDRIEGYLGGFRRIHAAR